MLFLALILPAAITYGHSDGGRPSARALHQMVYHGESDRVFLFGGVGTPPPHLGEALADTWAYDVPASVWAELSPLSSPPPVRDGRMAYDSGSDRIIQYQQGETWAYDLSNNTWIDMMPTSAPPTGPEGRRENPGMAYDSGSDRIILFGGRVDHTLTFYDDTWAYDFESNTWTEMHPAVRPPARILAGMAYDGAQDRVILFGGYAGIPLDDTWAYDYDSNTWTELNPPTAPSPRGGIGQGMVYDPGGGVVILFGGVDARTEQTNNETWTFDYASNIWTLLTPATAPCPRAWHGMVYVEATGKTVLFGGGPHREVTFTKDTWTYDSSTNVWTALDEPECPAPGLPWLLIGGIVATVGVAVGVVVLLVWRWKRRLD